MHFTTSTLVLGLATTALAAPVAEKRQLATDLRSGAAWLATGAILAQPGA